MPLSTKCLRPCACHLLRAFSRLHSWYSLSKTNWSAGHDDEMTETAKAMASCHCDNKYWNANSKFVFLSSALSGEVKCVTWPEFIALPLYSSSLSVAVFDYLCTFRFSTPKNKNWIFSKFVILTQKLCFPWRDWQQGWPSPWKRRTWHKYKVQNKRIQSINHWVTVRRISKEEIMECSLSNGARYNLKRISNKPKYRNTT